MTAFVTQQYTSELIERRMHCLEGVNGLESGTQYAETFYGTKPLLLDELPRFKGEVNFGRKVEDA